MAHLTNMEGLNSMDSKIQVEPVSDSHVEDMRIPVTIEEVDGNYYASIDSSKLNGLLRAALNAKFIVNNVTAAV